MIEYSSKKKVSQHLNHIIYHLWHNSRKKKKKSSYYTTSDIKNNIPEGIVGINKRKIETWELSEANTQFLERVGTGSQDSFNPSESSILSPFSTPCLASLLSRCNLVIYCWWKVPADDINNLIFFLQKSYQNTPVSAPPRCWEHIQQLRMWFFAGAVRELIFPFQKVELGKLESFIRLEDFSLICAHEEYSF